MGGAVAERMLPGGGVVRDEPEGEDVEGRGDVTVHGLFGGHVGGRAEPYVAAGEGGGVGGPRDAEVDDAGAVGGEEDVGRLEVAVDDAGRVDGLEGLGDAAEELQHGGDGEGAVAGDGGGEGGAGNVTDGEPGLGAVGEAVEDGCGVGAVDAPGGVDLLCEPPPELLVLRVLAPHDLQRHGLAAAGVRQIHHPHAAFPEPGPQSVTGYLPGITRPQLVHRVCPSLIAGVAMLRKGQKGLTPRPGHPYPAEGVDPSARLIGLSPRHAPFRR